MPVWRPTACWMAQACSVPDLCRIPPAFLQGFQRKLVGLPELTPLESLSELTRGRVLRLAQPEPGEGEPSITAALDPAAEIEEIAKAVRRQLEDGLSPRQIGVAFPEPRNYASLLLPIFGKYGIPWNMPGQSLADLPLGRAVSAFLTGEIAGWHKSHLQLLTAPGWGLPFSLTEEERRALRLAPPLEGLPAWVEYLGSFPGWEGALTLVRQVSQGFPAQPLAAPRPQPSEAVRPLPSRALSRLGTCLPRQSFSRAGTPSS